MPTSVTCVMKLLLFFQLNILCTVHELGKVGKFAVKSEYFLYVAVYCLQFVALKVDLVKF